MFEICKFTTSEHLRPEAYISSSMALLRIPRSSFVSILSNNAMISSGNKKSGFRLAAFCDSISLKGLSLINSSFNK